MTDEELQQLREKLVALRDECLGAELDPDGAVILSHAIRWLHFKLAGKPYEQPND